MTWGYRNILSAKNHTKTIDKIHKDFELHQVFMHNFLCQNVWILPLYIAYKKNQHILVQHINRFWSGGIETFWAQKVTEENSPKFTKIFEL